MFYAHFYNLLCPLAHQKTNRQYHYSLTGKYFLWGGGWVFNTNGNTEWAAKMEIVHSKSSLESPQKNVIFHGFRLVDGLFKIFETNTNVSQDKVHLLLRQVILLSPRHFYFDDQTWNSHFPKAPPKKTANLNGMWMCLVLY